MAKWQLAKRLSTEWLSAKIMAGQMAVGQTSVGQMTVDQMTLAQITVGQMAVVQNHGRPNGMAPTIVKMIHFNFSCLVQIFSKNRNPLDPFFFGIATLRRWKEMDDGLDGSVTSDDIQRHPTTSNDNRN